MIQIVVDAIGGDRALHYVVHGALAVAPRFDLAAHHSMERVEQDVAAAATAHQ